MVDNNQKNTQSDKNELFSDLDLKKLSPGERIEKLRKIEDERKKEIEEAERLIKESVEEIKQEQELRDEIEEEERLQKEELDKKKNDNLEVLIEETKQKIIDEEHYANTQYQVKLSMEPLSNLYDKVKEVYQEVRGSGEINEGQKQQLENLSYAMHNKEEAIDAGDYNTVGEQIEGLLSASKRILNYMKRG